MNGTGIHTDFLAPSILIYEPHYDRHVWIFRENPNGAFAQFNPDATCEHHRETAHPH